MTTQDRIKNWLDRVSQPDGLMEREDICFLMVQGWFTPSWIGQR